jgi:prepilin-type N-terminal cleavage/methylation domain-containing protein
MLNRQCRQGQRGFTLAEILVTTAIFAIIMIAALAVYDRSNQVFKTSTEAADMQQSTRIGFDKLISDIRMAGFDYSRGGQPQNAWEAPQADEQIEYAGETAVVFRSNFNYNSSAGTGNGLEPAFTPHNIEGKAIFPYVTTSNSEIIAYVLRSANASANTGSISFFVDDYQPRAVFPSTISPAPAGANPPHPEAQVTIGGIDLTNANPPYTLYRVTVADVLANSLGTPVAENIRSLNFKYYTDLAGTNLVTNADGTAITATRNADGSTLATANTGAVGGAGQYNADSVGTTTNFGDRNQRASIAAVRVNLVGMNASPDLQGYTNATETVAAVQKYRQYALSSLVVPRNLGLTGFPEPTYTTPGPPTIVGMCLGHCGAPVIYWTPPTSGAADSYRIEWDTNQLGAFGSYILINDPTLTQAIVPDDGVSDPSMTYYYRMESINQNGQSPASAMWNAKPQNRTKPQAPTALAGTPGQANRIPLVWNAPANNQSGSDILACNGTGGSTNGTAIPPQEIVKFRVSRGTDAAFDPNNPADPGVQLLGFTSASQPPQATGGAQVSWNDSGTTSAFYPANCVPYYYRVAALDRCYKQPTWNFSGNSADSISAYSSVVGPFQSTSSTAPQPPAAIQIDKVSQDGSGNLWTGCPDPSNLLSANCRVKLIWQPTVTDIATPANIIGIDRYVVTRRFRLQQAGGVYATDANFGTAGELEINCVTGTCTTGFSQQSPSAQLAYVDTPPFLNNGGLVLEYQYTLAAKNCSLYSGNSPYGIIEASENQSGQIAPLPPGPNPYVAFPGCSTNPAIVQAGAQNPAASGDSPSTAWVFNQGDTVTVTPSVGSTVTSVAFQLFTFPTPAQVGATQSINTPGPYVFTWGNIAGTDTYTLRITLNTIDAQNNPCQEVHVKYIQQQSPAVCFFSNVAPPAPIIVSHPANPETDHIDFTVTNSGNEPIRFNMAPGLNGVPLSGPTFNGGYNVTWTDPDLPNHKDLAITSIQWGVPSAGYSFTQVICVFNSTCVPAGGTISTITSSGTTATVTTSSAHNMVTGDVVTINNINNAVFNGTKTITRISNTQFTVPITSCGNCSGAQANSNGMLYAAQRKINLTMPATMPNVPANGTFTIRVNFTFDGHGSIPSMPSSPSAILKFCLRYRILTEQTIDKNCNLVGQAASTANPTSCD